MTVPDLSRKWGPGHLLFSLVLLTFGLYLLPLAITAFRTGERVHGLSISKAYDWFEVLWTSLGSIALGLFGVWNVWRDRNR